MVRQMNVLIGDVPYKLLFYFEWRLDVLIHKPEAFRNAEDMGVYSHSRLIIDDGGYHIRRFPTYARQFLKVLWVFWDD